ncbi:hypothetical protein HYW83_04895 [Candidatus Peregrinibacteria bacterium]|nr:hypothetical protein [Candidatus Peregrinibacteria bacterium]
MLEHAKDQIGPKAQNLKRLIDAGLNVPQFSAVPVSTVQQFINEGGEIIEKQIQKFIHEIQEKFPRGPWIIRSSALIEDSEKESFAGQFMTQSARNEVELFEAICAVLCHAFEYLHGDLGQFSFIVQEYIDADFSGITFTRSPLGGREMVIEYHHGIGEDVVGGRIKPQKKEFYWHQQDIDMDLPNFHEAFENFKKIEQLFQSPQDIEWCIKGGVWYFLQSRSITTITADQYRQFLFLDDALPKNAKFFFEKTEISEIAPRPTPATWNLLERIYAKDGPIQRVYSRYGVQYNSQNFLKKIGGELFVDRECEIKTLLPSYSYLSKNDFQPRFASLRGFFQTVRNIIALNRIPTAGYKNLLSGIREKLNEQFTKEEKFEEAAKEFLRNYELVFEINFLAQKAVKRLLQAIKKEPISTAYVLSFSVDELDMEFDDSDFVGNSLEIADESPFVKFKSSKSNRKEFQDWFDSLPAWKKKYFAPFIESAQHFNKLREFGRYITVKNVSRLRRALHREGKSEVLQPQDKNFQNLPSRLTSSPLFAADKPIGVSRGKAHGKLIDESQISQHPDGILYTKILSPDLTKYFGDIKGIVSESGGLLSHLAIMAREKGIPVVVNFDLFHAKIKLGDFIEIDGETGSVVSLQQKRL